MHGLDEGAVLQVAHGRRTAETVTAFAPELDLDQEVARLLEWELNDTLDLVALAGAKAAMESLSPSTCAIVTSGSRALAELRLRCAGLPRPPVLVSADDVQRGKPDPEGYRLGASRIGVPPRDCIVVEDSPPGIAAAKAAGMTVIAVLTTHTHDAVSHADEVIQNLANFTAVDESGTYQIELNNHAV